MATMQDQADGSTAILLPVRGSDAIEILISDHLVIKDLLRALTQASDAAGRTKALGKLKGVLTVHNATEENLVYPALDKVAGKHMKSQHLFHETANADTLIFELDTMLKEGLADEAAGLAEKIQSAVLEHIDDEEQSAFPALQKHSEPKQAEMLTAAVREFRSSLHFESATA